MPEPIIERLLIKFDGKEAAEGSLDIDDLANTLRGWEDFLTLSASIYQTRQLTTILPDPKERPKVLVEAPKKGSFELVVMIILGLPPAVLAILQLNDREDVRRWSSNGVKWIESLFKKHEEIKSGFYTREQAAEALAQLASEHQIELSRDVTQASKVAEQVDQSVKRATYPVTRSASTMSVTGITTPSFSLDVDYAMRQHLHSGYHLGQKTEHYFPARVIVDGAYRKTGHCYVFVEESQDNRFKGNASGMVAEQDILNKPRNPYIGSLYRQESLDIWVAPESDTKNQEKLNWKFYLEEPKPTTPLLDGLVHTNLEKTNE